MPINFLDNVCKTNSSKQTFGLCDDPPPATKPSYIDETNSTEWIATINNPDSKEVSFYAIDHCVEVLRPDGSRENRCDGILHYDTNLLFVELKVRTGSGWLGDASNQLAVTHRNFFSNHDISSYTKIEAYVCNKLIPLARSGHNIVIQKFKNATGLILNIQKTINV